MSPTGKFSCKLLLKKVESKDIPVMSKDTISSRICIFSMLSSRRPGNWWEGGETVVDYIFRKMPSINAYVKK